MSNTTEARDAKAKTAVRSAFAAYYVDMLDIYLPVLVLAPAIQYFVSSELSSAWTAVVSAMIFVATLLGRPLGAGIFGHLADTLGRKRVAVITMGMSGVSTLLMALMLGYQQWGVLAVILFVLLRFVNGIFIGGQYTAANPLAMEFAPKHKRGIYGASINCAFPAAYVTVALTVMLLVASMSSTGLDSAYVQWGWRIPFAAVGLLGVALAVHYWKNVEESEVWMQEQAAAPTEKKPAAAKALLSGEARQTFLQVFILMTGLWLALQSVAAILPGILKSAVGLSPTSVTVTLVVAYLALIGANLTAGSVSQRRGRRPTFITLGILVGTVGTALYFLLINQGSTLTFPVLLLLVACIVCIVDSPFALVIAYINERFQVGERASGYGLSYSLSVIIPSFYAYYQLWLSAVMPFEYTVLVLLVVGGILIVVGAAMGPETKDVDFAATESLDPAVPARTVAD